MLRGLSVGVGTKEPQAVEILVERPDVFRGDGEVIAPLLRGPPDDLVVDVGEVPDVGDVVPGVPRVPDEEVERHVGEIGEAQV